MAWPNGEDEQSLIKDFLQMNGWNEGKPTRGSDSPEERGPFPPLDLRELRIICSCKKELPTGAVTFGCKNALKVSPSRQRTK